MTRRVCYVTGTRADYGLMERTLKAIDNCAGLELSLLVTGTHLAEEFGATFREIEAAGFRITARIPVDYETSNGATMARNIGHMIVGMVDALQRERPDLLLVLGDRGEMLAGALAAIHLGIPIAHIHGGERSGTVDEPIRHAISKLAHIHLVATEDSRQRLIRMGERGDLIFVTGAPGLDGITSAERFGRATLLKDAGLVASRPTALLLLHPVVQEADQSGDVASMTLAALADCGLQVFALRANSDAGGQMINETLQAAAARGEIRLATHCPRPVFLSWMAAVDVMVGNSSAGIVEAAAFGTPVVNIGSRQHLRERNANVLDVHCDPKAVRAAIRRAATVGRFPIANVYGDGNAAERIATLLLELPLEPALLMKSNAY